MRQPPPASWLLADGDATAHSVTRSGMPGHG